MIPIVDVRCLDAHRASLARAVRDVGAFELLLPPSTAALVERTMEAARAFFALPPEDKRAIDIAGSPHHRGYSEMHNERDWREQLHFAREECSVSDGGGAHLGLTGPNRWPDRLGEEFRQTILAHMDAVAALGARLIDALLAEWQLESRPMALLSPAGALPRAAEAAHLVMKILCYHPQAAATPPRSGVAPHVDYSLLTLVAQDDTSGLELLLRDGTWVKARPRLNALLVNAGELLEAIAGGRARATPHRVINPSHARSRISIPLFVNPPLEATLMPQPREPRAESAHVHRALPAGALQPFHYGAGEWRRKGDNVWCEECCGKAETRL